MTINEFTDKSIKTWRRRCNRFLKYKYTDKFSDIEIAEIADDCLVRMDMHGEIMEVALIRAFERLKPILGW